ncbi:hypothetical protein ACIBF5_09510 [Micromonospora sp. NPDC050417]|uniref:hypothetical protein n=1 Tax=Micromonospora sp. NPDC050417 TaxID=3364280 RepID=UPI0037AE3A3D
MADPHNRRLKQIEFTLGGEAFQCQVQNWNIANNTEDGERLFTQCPEGETREETDPDYALEVTFLADWRENGVSDYLVLNDGVWVEFQLDHHPDIPGEHVRWTGEVRIKAPNVGGDARTTEQTEVTMPIKGKPLYSRPA